MQFQDYWSTICTIFDDKVFVRPILQLPITKEFTQQAWDIHIDDSELHAMNDDLYTILSAIAIYHENFVTFRRWLQERLGLHNDAICTMMSQGVMTVHGTDNDHPLAYLLINELHLEPALVLEFVKTDYQCIESLCKYIWQIVHGFFTPVPSDWCLTNIQYISRIDFVNRYIKTPDTVLAMVTITNPGLATAISDIEHYWCKLHRVIYNFAYLQTTPKFTYITRLLPVPTDLEIAEWTPQRIEQYNNIYDAVLAILHNLIQDTNIYVDIKRRLEQHISIDCRRE